MAAACGMRLANCSRRRQSFQTAATPPCFRLLLIFVVKKGALDPATMGSVSKRWPHGQESRRIWLTRTRPSKWKSLASSASSPRMELFFTNTDVESGDIWRACQTKDAPIRDWVKLAVSRARASATPAVFWLDSNRAHDAQLIAKVENLSCRSRHRRTRDQDIGTGRSNDLLFGNASKKDSTTISVFRQTFLRDLPHGTCFQSSKWGTSAKMLSIVPLMKRWRTFRKPEPVAPRQKHVQQFEKEGHLRWDSLGEFLALAVSLEHYRDRHSAPQAGILADALDAATTQLLLNGKSSFEAREGNRQSGKPLLFGALLG